MGSGLGIRIPVDSKATVRALTNLQRKQLPYAISEALNKTAKKAALDNKKATIKYFDRPTPWTKKAFRIIYAKKTSLKAYLSIFPKQWEYMQYQIDGGVRPPSGRSIPVPTRNLTDLNRYGSIKRGKIKQMLNHPDVFSGTVKGIGGIWHRLPNGGVKLLIAWEPKATYRKRYPFAKITRLSVRKNYSRIFKAQLAKALRTAK